GGIGPCVALSPTMPQYCAGPLTDRGRSLPPPRGESPAAIATASPPLDPPGVRSGFQGFTDRPSTAFAVSLSKENSGTLVFARRIPPAALRRRTAVASVEGT